ncbi:hypothetical protein PoB_004279200 [Plakobranchus ocellatus]|uniref:Secreted protein n=1 Tax=Plakobranchus ocellatus TaxID=259542 RepID=A0AAV4BAV1_9GAST|nr:hypothetical protein PoB_004279200 [Plakobranchus ocellatus]
MINFYHRMLHRFFFHFTMHFASHNLANSSTGQQKWTMLSHPVNQPWRKPPCSATPNPTHRSPLPQTPLKMRLELYWNSAYKACGSLLRFSANGCAPQNRSIAHLIESC